ncbi:MAG: SusD/RagB family nutrient-binding outer membrane lipoprotein [Balneolaceae bacterium]|nr:SusD/RagB family nutrient-binding outer membrane lipoprotein [Balneolaceae bacterium]
MRQLTLLILILSLGLASCDVTRLNENEKAPTNVPADPLFSNAQVTYGNFVHQTDVNIGIFKLMAQYWTTTTYTDEPRYNLRGRGISDNIWDLYYRDVLIDLKEAAEKISTNEALPAAEKQNKLASIEVMQTLAYIDLVNIFGNVPYTEALNFENPQPAYDDAETIYMSQLDSLNTAISNFDPSAAGFGSADVYFNGDMNMWVKFANSLKMRIGIMLADVNPSAAETAITSAAPNAFDEGEAAMMPFTAAPPHTNPNWEALVQSGRDDYLPAAPVVNRMNNLDDPRRPVFFTKLAGEYVGAPYGASNNYNNYSHFSAEIERKDRDGTILDYAEVEFILAEAAARGYGVSGTAAQHYNNGITADMKSWGISDAEIAAYLAQPEVAYATASGGFREKIGTQKWLALFLQGLQGWIIPRRLGYPALDPPKDGSGNEVIPKVITRFTYPVSEETFNQENYNAAGEAIGGDTRTTELFWDVED